jgi:hypothetical protein
MLSDCCQKHETYKIKYKTGSRGVVLLTITNSCIILLRMYLLYDVEGEQTKPNSDAGCRCVYGLRDLHKSSERTPIDPGTEYGLPILPPLLKLVHRLVHSSLG